MEPAFASDVKAALEATTGRRYGADGTFWMKRPLPGLGLSDGWGTWIRTKTGGVRVRCPTVRRSPNCLTISSNASQLTRAPGMVLPSHQGVLAAGLRAWQGS